MWHYMSIDRDSGTYEENRQMDELVNSLLAEIERSEINSREVDLIPDRLSEALAYQRKLMLDNTPFKVYPARDLP